MPALAPVLASNPTILPVEKEWSSSCSPSSGGCVDPSAAKDGAAGDASSCGHPPKPQPKELPRLHVVTVATHADGYFTSLLYSSVLLQTGLRVLGWGEKWKGFGMKQVKLVEYCRRVPPRDVVMLVDGFDTVLLQPSEVIVRKFLEFGGRVVLTGESRSDSLLSSFFLMFHNCIFKSADSKHWPKPLPYANKHINVRLLNAGAMIGYAADLIALFKDFEYSWNDQRYLSELFLKEPHKVVTIDANCSIFSLYRLRDQHKVLTYEEAEKQARHVVPYFPGDATCNEEAAKKRRPAPSFQRSALKGVLIDAVTHETPCVLHMYCRRNADSLIQSLGLPKGETILNLWHLIWYAFFSLRGTLLHVSDGKTQWHMPYVTAFLSAVVTGVGIVGLILNALVYLVSLLIEHGVFTPLQQFSTAALGSLPLIPTKCGETSRSSEDGKQPQVPSAWFNVLQLVLQLAQMLGATLAVPAGAVVYFIILLLPVFVVFTVAGASVLGVCWRLHGGFGDEDEDQATATAAADIPVGKKKKQ